MTRVIGKSTEHWSAALDDARQQMRDRPGRYRVLFQLDIGEDGRLEYIAIVEKIARPR